MMKNSAKAQKNENNWDKLCTSPELLFEHIHKKLHNRKQKSYIYNDQHATPAAVLIPIFFKNNQAHLLFTKRTTRVATHKGQISFPGGRMDDTDPDLKYTALRETEEEVGIFEKDVDIIGQTDIFLTNTSFLVTPYVGVYRYPYPYKVNPHEIDRLIEVPLIHLLQDDIFRLQKIKRHGYKWNIHYYQFNDDIIWGVTGFLLSNFLSILFDLDRDQFLEVVKINE